MKGSHGTCVSRAEEIKKKSFRLNPGIKGDGVYFWAYSSNESLAKALAIGWWEKCNKDKVYAKESNTDCAVLGVSLVVEEAYCLNFEDLSVRESFINFCASILSRLEAKKGEKKEDKEAVAYDLFVKKIEEVSGKQIKVVKVKVPPPKKLNYPLSIAYLGSPLCYVVKDVDCIKNVWSMEVENE